ncbi:MAG TPA: molybdopterin converting factor subunit 1 [Novimethylophilus sp.]|uniref:molybdopterin converting factor subunit 1 n=1 Tax=Novimethylophilus sp. TaxID=2137426 RepID=UPI002F3E7E9C
MNRAVRILYFARLRESLGLSAEEAALPDDVADVAGLMRWLAARGGAWQQEFDGCRQIRAAINQELVPDAAPVAAGDEVAFFPPVTGG